MERRVWKENPTEIFGEAPFLRLGLISVLRESISFSCPLLLTTAPAPSPLSQNTETFITVFLYCAVGHPEVGVGGMLLETENTQ